MSGRYILAYLPRLGLKIYLVLVSFWLVSKVPSCVFTKILASIVLFLCFLAVVPPGLLAEFRGTELDESGSPGIAHRLPKPRPER